MVIISTRALEVIIHAVSPLSILGMGAAAAGAAAAGAPAGASAAAAGAAVAAGGAGGAAWSWASAAPVITIRAATPAKTQRPTHFVKLFMVNSPGSVVCVQSASLSVSPVRMRTT